MATQISLPLPPLTATTAIGAQKFKMITSAGLEPQKRKKKKKEKKLFSARVFRPAPTSHSPSQPLASLIGAPITFQSKSLYIAFFKRHGTIFSMTFQLTAELSTKVAATLQCEKYPHARKKSRCSSKKRSRVRARATKTRNKTPGAPLGDARTRGAPT